MGTKRERAEPEPHEAVHASRQLQVYGSNPKPAKKARHTEPPVYRKQAHASSVNAIKKRIRDVSRRLERAEDLPATVRIEDERALAAYEQELAGAHAEKVRQKMIKKYHMVRFFERQKASRQLKKLRKRLLQTDSTEEVERLKHEMHIAEVDLNYSQYFPLSEPYISLYPQKGSAAEESEDSSKTSKPPLWEEVESCMEKGTLDKLRNRLANIPIVPTKPLVKRPAKPKPRADPVPTLGLNRRQRRSQVKAGERGNMKGKSMGFSKNQEFGAAQGTPGDTTVFAQGDNDSDGGFF